MEFYLCWLRIIFVHADAAADPAQLPFAAAGGADMPTIGADDMQLPDLMVMLDSDIPD